MKREEGSSPVKAGGVAQLGEHLPCKQGVRSSILLISTRSSNWPRGDRGSEEDTLDRVCELTEIWAYSSAG